MFEILRWFVWIVELAYTEESRKVARIEKCAVMRWVELVNCFLGNRNIFKSITTINWRKPIMLERVYLREALTRNILGQIPIWIETNRISFLSWRRFSRYPRLTYLKQSKILVGAHFSTTIRVIKNIINSWAPFWKLPIKWIQL